MNLYGLIGYPLGHSFSKKYFTQKFEKEGLRDNFFELFPIKDIEEFTGLIQSHPALKGLAVTIPYKQSVIPFLQSVSDEAMQIGAVNCIKILPGECIGYNTDVLGFEKSFFSLLKPQHNKALIFGSGGASKAVQFVLNKMMIPFLLVSRTQVSTNTINYSDLDEATLQEYTIIINTSPIGMTPNENEMPAIPYQFIGSQHLLFDLIYQPSETKFLAEGRSRGAAVKNGLDMLIIQAEENWKIWNSD
ncbi:MAG: shikimate dehydrogenase [Ferruginibacter sp.]